MRALDFVPNSIHNLKWPTNRSKLAGLPKVLRVSAAIISSIKSIMINAAIASKSANTSRCSEIIFELALSSSREHIYRLAYVNRRFSLHKRPAHILQYCANNSHNTLPQTLGSLRLLRLPAEAAPSSWHEIVRFNSNMTERRTLASLIDQ